MDKVTKPYSKIVISITIFLSCLTLIKFLLDTTIFWLFIGLSIIATILIALNYKIDRGYPNSLPTLNKRIILLFSIFNIIILFYSASYGLFLIISYLNIQHITLIYIPYIASLFLILGNLISFYQIELFSKSDSSLSS